MVRIVLVLFLIYLFLPAVNAFCADKAVVIPLITKAKLTTSDFYGRTVNKSVNSSTTTFSASVDCYPGDLATGGGFFLTGLNSAEFDKFSLYASSPKTDVGWIIQGKNNSGIYTVVVSVLCVKISQ